MSVLEGREKLQEKATNRNSDWECKAKGRRLHLRRHREMKRSETLSNLPNHNHQTLPSVKPTRGVLRDVSTDLAEYEITRDAYRHIHSVSFSLSLSVSPSLPSTTSTTTMAIPKMPMTRKLSFSLRNCFWWLDLRKTKKMQKRRNWLKKTKKNSL